MKELYGKKIGMTQVFDEDGEVTPVTVIEAYPLTIIGKKTIARDGYTSLVVGFGVTKETKLNKPMKGVYAKAGVEVKRYIREIRLDNTDEYEIGNEINLEIFKKGDHIDAHGISLGKGFQGPIKRHGLHLGPKTHGSNYHRRPGSMGAGSSPGRVFKNKSSIFRRTS
jgi:large subunit ribosomal protein L3